ncbi:MAG TPA: hypothetical protein V6C85_08715 [Allocoleopsis sp.]
MRILEQTKDVLTLQNSAINYWFGTIAALFGSLFGMLLIAGMTGWWQNLWLVVGGGFCLALQQIWSSNVVKVCSFNRTLRKVTVKFHGLPGKTKDFFVRDIQKIEVRKTTGFAYGVALERYQLWLVTRSSATTIPLSEEHPNQVLLESLANLSQECLSLNH